MSKLPGFKKISEKLLSPNGARWLMIIGITGIALIFLSQILSSGAKQQTKTQSSSSPGLAEYTDALEGKIEELVSKIDGVGKTQVVITFASGTQNVYEQQTKESESTLEQTQKDGEKQSTQQSGGEQSPVIVSSDDGQQPLIVKQVTPQVEGVVVVCQGGGDPIVQENVTQAVSTALGVSANHVFVTRMSQQAGAGSSN